MDEIVENNPENSSIHKKDVSESEDRVNQNNQKEEDEEEDIDEELESQIKSKKLEVKITDVSTVLEQKNLNQEDNNKLIQFDLYYVLKDEYHWTIYRTPKQIQIFFKEMLRSLKNVDSKIDKELIEKYTTICKRVKEFNESQILDSPNFIKDQFTLMMNENFFKRNKLINEFFGISAGSFNQLNNGKKPFEGYAYKRADPHCMRRVFGYACKCLECWIFKQYNRRWVILKDDSISYSDSADSQGGKTVYFFDSESQADRVGKATIRIKFLSRKLELSFSSFFERELFKQEFDRRILRYINLIKNNEYKAFTNEKARNLASWFIDGKDYFEDLFEKLMDAKESIFITDWWMSPELWLKRPITTNEFTGPLKTDAKTDKLSRIMDVLNHKAKQGVKVYVLIYYECSLALNLNSKHTEDTLEKLDKNIMVTRHPKEAFDLLWSHHEKLVIIDQMIGYVGGLDLCWGRYDFKEHPIYEKKSDEYYFPCIDYSNARIRDFVEVQNYLIESIKRDKEPRMPWHDVHTRIIGPAVADIARHFVERWNHAKFEDRDKSSENLTTVKQSSSFRPVKKAINPHGFMMNIINQINVINCNQELKDDVTRDDATDEISKSKTLKNSSINEKDESSFVIKDEYKDLNSFIYIPCLNIKNNDISRAKCEIVSENSNQEKKTNLGEDSNEIKEDSDISIPEVPKFNNKINNLDNGGKFEKISELHHFKSNEESIIIHKEDNTALSISEIKKGKTTTMSPIKIGLHKQESRLKKFMENKEEVDEDHLMVKHTLGTKLRAIRLRRTKGMPSYYSRLINKIGKFHNISNKWFKDIFKSQMDNLETKIKDKYFANGSVTSKVQVLRSVCKWSAGMSKTENSILEAYYRLIDEAENYIYIENQFFISKSFDEEERKDCKFATNKTVQNEIALHIRKRILKAYDEGKKFRVFVFIPLLPGFAGDPEKSGTIQIIMKHTYAGISDNHGLSIIEKLEEKMGSKWQEYIFFFSLRNHGYVNDVPKTEIVYIHSKLMIVDDKKVLCGSANINDRSMKGTRDSEFAVLIKETLKEKIKMDGKDKKVAKFAASFRKALMAEHLNIDVNDEILIDPLSDELHKFMIQRAQDNTLKYREIFRCYPDDTCKNFKTLRSKFHYPKNEEEEKELKANYEKYKNDIKGHIVEFPLQFLKEEDLGISFFAVENLVPERNFT